MTIIEQQAYDAIIRASKKYVSTDWERRRYEIAKTILPTCVNHAHELYNRAPEYIEINQEQICQWAVSIADELIKRLKA